MDTIYIVLEGGIVQAVVTKSGKGQGVTVIDYDVDGSDLDDDKIVAVKQHDGTTLADAWVYDVGVTLARIDIDDLEATR